MALKVGIQMYSVREHFAKDPVGTIEKVAGIGFKYLEFANLDAHHDSGSGFGANAKEVRAAVDRFGCEIIGSHIAPFDKTNVDSVLKYHTELGSKYLMSKPFNGTKEENLQAAELYNYLGERCHEAGIQHVLHTGIPNYDENGEWTLDIMAKHTEPKNLMYELDTYWILRSDYGVIETIKRFGDRIIFIHEKDMPRDFKGTLNINSLLPLGKSCGGYVDKNFFDYVNKEDFIEIGEGTMDHQSIIDATIEHCPKATHVILEQDYTQLDEIDSVRISMNNFKKMNNIDFS